MDIDEEIADLCVQQPRFAWIVGRARFAACSLGFRLCVHKQRDLIMLDLETILGPKAWRTPPALTTSEALERGRGIVRSIFSNAECHPLCPCRFDLQAWALEEDRPWRKRKRKLAKGCARRAGSGGGAAKKSMDSSSTTAFAS